MRARSRQIRSELQDFQVKQLKKQNLYTISEEQGNTNSLSNRSNLSINYDNSLSALYQNSQEKEEMFNKKHFTKEYSISDPVKQNEQIKYKNNLSINCLQCLNLSLKLEELNNLYSELIQQKNNEIDEFKQIILKLESKLMQNQTKSTKEIQKNRQIRSQIQKLNFDEILKRERNKEIIEYLKNRQLELLNQINQNQNENFYLKLINKKSLDKKDDESQGLGSNTTSKKSLINNESDIRQFQSKLSENRQKENKQMTMTINIDKVLDVCDRIPLCELVRRNNEIQSLKDNIMVLGIKNKIECVKNIQIEYLIKNKIECVKNIQIEYLIKKN